MRSTDPSGSRRRYGCWSRPSRAWSTTATGPTAASCTKSCAPFTSRVVTVGHRRAPGCSRRQGKLRWSGSRRWREGRDVHAGGVAADRPQTGAVEGLVPLEEQPLDPAVGADLQILDDAEELTRDREDTTADGVHQPVRIGGLRAAL